VRVSVSVVLMRERLAPKPFRGDQVAAGTVVLAVLVLLLNVRMGSWSTGLHLAYTAAATALVLGMSVAAPNDPAGPPAWHATLYVAGFLLAGATLVRLADVLGSDGGSGTAVWVGLALTALATWMSRGRNSAGGTLLAALTGVVTSLALLDWVGHPDGVGPYRYLVLADIVVLTLMALWQRIRGPAHGVQLLNAIGLTLLGLALTFVAGAYGFLLGGGSPDAPHVGGGWTTLVFAGGIGILSAGAADRERGNVLIGIVLLLSFVGLAASGDLLGWPIPLAGAAAALLVIGLRPSTPLPNEPPAAFRDDDPDLGPPLPVPPLR
jgi:hypothetical protein